MNYSLLACAAILKYAGQLPSIRWETITALFVIGLLLDVGALVVSLYKLIRG